MIGAAESGLLATVGVKEVLVHPAPRIAVLSTGGTTPHFPLTYGRTHTHTHTARARD